MPSILLLYSTVMLYSTVIYALSEPPRNGHIPGPGLHRLGGVAGAAEGSQSARRMARTGPARTAALQSQLASSGAAECRDGQACMASPFLNSKCQLTHHNLKIKKVFFFSFFTPDLIFDLPDWLRGFPK
jgi:hypothetical protein